jgi:hypothetical protein
VVDHEVHGDEGVDPLRVGPEPLHRGAHGGQVHDRGHAGEVLEDHPGGHEGQLHVLRSRRVPGPEVLHVLRGDELAVDAPEDSLEQDLDREGQAGEAGGDPRLLESREPVDRGSAEAGVEGGTGAERVGLHGFSLRWPVLKLIPARGPAETAGLSGS